MIHIQTLNFRPSTSHANKSDRRGRPIPGCLLLCKKSLTATRGIPGRTPLTGSSSSGRAVLGTQLDPVCLIVDVEDAFLDLVVDLPGSVDEGLLHVGGSLGRGFHEDEPVLPCKGLPLLPLHVSTCFQVAFVAYEHDHHVAVAVLPCVLQPRCQVVESVSPCDVIYKQSPCCTPVVRPCDRPKCFLARRVPNLKLDLFPLNVDHPSAELDPDGEVVHRLEPLVRELEQQAGLAHPCVPDDDVLEQVAVGHCDGGRGQGGGQ